MFLNIILTLPVQLATMVSSSTYEHLADPCLFFLCHPPHLPARLDVHLIYDVCKDEATPQGCLNHPVTPCAPPPSALHPSQAPPYRHTILLKLKACSEPGNSPGALHLTCTVGGVCAPPSCKEAATTQDRHMQPHKTFA